MLKPEAAKKQLEAWTVEIEDRFVPEAGKLPAALRGIAYGLLDCDAKGKPREPDDWKKRQEMARRAVGPLDALTPKDRLRVFSVFFAGLAPSVEAGWQFLKRGTYQQDYTRKSFRAPNDPAVTFGRRVSWLTDLLGIAQRYRSDVLTPAWLAAWAPHLDLKYGSEQETIGRLLAAVIDAEGKEADEVFDILCRSAHNEHEIGAMGRHVTRGLLMASRPEGWELMEKTLLAAQRQEGLRQAILETVDEAHPEAFRRMVRLIRDHGLARFSAVVRAANVWFGLGWDSVSTGTVNATLDQVLRYLDDPKARAKALAGNDAEAVFLALWATSFEDAPAAVPVAAGLLAHKRVEVRYVAALHLSQLGLPQTHAARAAALDDEDLRVALCALSGGGWSEENMSDDLEHSEGLFERLQRLFDRMPPKSILLKPLVWPWTQHKASREEIAGRLVQALGDRPPTVLIPYLPAIHSWYRRNVVERLAQQKKWDALTRDTLLELAGDASSDVRGTAFQSLAKAKLLPAEIARLEGYLSRKTSDLRQGVVGLLLQQADPQALASADRLLASGDTLRRRGGLEVLRQLAAAKRSREACVQRAEAYRSGRKKLSREEQTQIDGIVTAPAEQWTLDNALGLMDPAERSPAVPPKDRKVTFLTEAAVACLRSLDDLVHQHRETTIKYKTWDGEKEDLLGNVGWGFPSPPRDKPPEKGKEELPLAEVWEEWYACRPKSLRDGDGFELQRAGVWLGVAKHEWDWERFQEWGKRSAERKKVLARLAGGFGRTKLKYPNVVDDLVNWMMYLHSPPDTADFLLNAVETAFALVPQAELDRLAAPPKEDEDNRDDDEDDWREAKPFELWPDTLHGYFTGFPKALTPERAARRWQLLRWRDEPFAGARRKRPSFEVLAQAYEQGAATGADLLDHLLGPRATQRYGMESFSSLSELTQRKLDKNHEAFLNRCPQVREAVEQCRRRIVDLELARGETPTAATAAAREIQSLWGTDLLVRLITSLDKEGFKVSIDWRQTHAKASTLTALTKVTYPQPGETPEHFARATRGAMAEGRLSERRLLELAFLAPQWAKCVEDTLGWSGFSEGLYWFLAHMQYTGGASEQAAIGAGIDDEPEEPATADGDADAGSGEEDQPRERLSAWDRLIAERTPLSWAERIDGAVDVGWFRRTYEQLTPKRWQAMAEAAKFAVNAAQARRAEFVAEVLTGKASRRDLIAGVRKKKLKDYVRLLGLYPLAEGAKRDADLEERYRVLQEYKRYARGLSAMTKPQATRAAEIGMQNLARTAGYPDPLRLEWALEAEQVKDLARGPISASRDGVTVTLALDEQAQPQLTVQRSGKPLKSVPPVLKKDKRIAELAERATELKRQASRMKGSLEAAMCRGDTFSGAELARLCRHAILAPLLGRLILVGDGILGYPEKQGRALRNVRGKLEPVKKGESLRIAHPHDLLEGGQWDAWQHECFRAERVQPFKQVFRELYVVTKQERRDRTVSHRYAGQQVQPKQAMALWGQRGWSTQDGVWKMFHDLGLVASVSFQFGAFTPLEIEGLTIDSVEFRRRDELKPLALAEVPSRIFSEVMRDVDLVVSVAHRGGVDPEASASTVEMRARLLGETCALLGLKNVRLKDSHALVDGELGRYSVHLGSATVHRLPGGAVCLVAVPAQHRGRLFLPFADDDPRTAEVLSKVILLARDTEIQDPTILDQLRR